MGGWLNFVEPVRIFDSVGTPTKEFLGHTPETVGIASPLVNGRIKMSAEGLRYIRAMSAAWADTLHSGLPGSRWVAEAGHLGKTYLGDGREGREAGGSGGCPGGAWSGVEWDIVRVNLN